MIQIASALLLDTEARVLYYYRMGCDEAFPKTLVAVRLQLAISHQTGAIKASPRKEEVFFSKNEARGISEHDALDMP